MDTPHKLIKDTFLPTGDHPSQARTRYACELCGEWFVHWYNIDDDIHEAAKAHGFDINYCSGVKDATEADSQQEARSGGLSEDGAS